MKIIGIICEYNPFHLGHWKQIRRIRQEYGANCGIVCLMSGNYVQRGAPAVFDKAYRARAAVACGVDLVLELPLPCVLSSAEGFASGGVRILSGFCDGLSFGTESGTRESLVETAQTLLSPEFLPWLRQELNTGKSFPAARQTALEKMHCPGDLLSKPNNILAVEYCKAVLCQHSTMELLPMTREGGYHDELPDPENPSATALRKQILEGGDWHAYIPAEAVPWLADAPIHTMEAGELAVLGKLRSMTEAEFEALPHGGEGLWRKCRGACHSEATLEEILTAVKSKRYTRSRLDRMVLCAFLGITPQMLACPAPYTRVLAMNDRGRRILNKARGSGRFLHTGEKTEEPYWLLEQQWDDLYGLFCVSGPEKPGREPKRRIFYRPDNREKA